MKPKTLLDLTFILTLLTCMPLLPLHAEPGHLTVHVDQPGVKISPTLYGLMTEEINHSYDGGLYGELIQNRAFKDNVQNPVHWSMVQPSGAASAMALDNSLPLSAALSTSLRLDITASGAGQRVGVANEGYWGIPVKPHSRYRASFYARSTANFAGPLMVDIESNDGTLIYSHAHLSGFGPAWKKYTATLTMGNVTPTTAARFVISATTPGTVWLNLVSLFPPTYHNTPNGARIDLMQKLGDMRPAFLRLPGGNYLEGNSIPERFEWRDTIGPLTQRPGHKSPWGYRSSDGMGLLEFLEWCEDLKMQPVLAVFAGYALNGTYIPPGPQLQPYVQDALDEIEYITGPASTKWGAVRAKDGHPRPFSLTYVEISNEDGGHEYEGRFAQFFDAIRAKYPNLKVIATSVVHTRVPDVVDDHYYRSAAAMEADTHHYDTYNRMAPKIFVGEWATTEGSPTPTLNAALGDAAWMTGMERNSDVVVISSYAPLLVNVNPGAAQWGTNLIGYDAIRSYGSPSYYAQLMFAQNRGDVVLPVDIEPQGVTAPLTKAPQGMIGVGTWSTQAEYRNIKVTQADATLYQKDFVNGDDDWHFGPGDWQAQDGVLRQTGSQINDRATAGDPQWTDYTYTLQARKMGGAEGFLILFHVQDDDNFVWWNVGGWGNTRTGLERSRHGIKQEIGQSTPVTVENGHWYDIKIEVHGTDIKCYLGGKLISHASDAVPVTAPVYATASRDLKSGDVILKVVNTTAAPQSLQIDMPGAQSVGKSATALVLSGQPQDVNSLDDPEKVAPRSIPITDAAGAFIHQFPGYSVSVIRLKVR